MRHLILKGKDQDNFNKDGTASSSDDLENIQNAHQKMKQDYQKREKRLAKVYHLPSSQRKTTEKPLAKDLFVTKSKKSVQSALEVFHAEILAEPTEELVSIEDRYWLGLSNYIDSECTPAKHREITEHLIDCPLCRERFKELQNLNKVIADTKVDELGDMQDGDDFWEGIAEVIDSEELKNEFHAPDRIFASLKKYKKAAIIVALTAIVGLGGIASFKYKEEYNYVLLPEDGDIKWSKLGLNKEQKVKLSLVEEKWQDLKTSEEEFINSRKANLDKELSKQSPNLRLIDKLQREILDHEILLKREEANSFLEKRFILTEEQTFKLLEQLKKTPKKS